jgi:hypothetical protein
MAITRNVTDPKLPRKLKILRSESREGTLTLMGKLDDGWIVDWDAAIKSMRGMQDGYVMDRCVMTSDEIKKWTGLDPETQAS